MSRDTVVVPKAYSDRSTVDLISKLEIVPQSGQCQTGLDRTGQGWTGLDSKVLPVQPCPALWDNF